MRTPTENGFCSIVTPAACTASNVSRAECPQASTTRRAAIRSAAPVRPSSTSTPVTAPPAKRTPASCAWKRTSPPASSIWRRIVRTTSTSRSVPMCGFACQRISSGAPMPTNQRSTWRAIGFLMFVVSFPSENVPAPPSPNWMFVCGSRSPPAANASTAARRSSTSPPRSSTSGRSPARAR